MPPRKRKPAEQPTLEDVVDEPVKVTKSRKGDLAHPKKEVKPKQAASQAAKDDDGDDLFLQRRARKTGVEQPPPTKAKEAKPGAAEAGPQSTGSHAGIWCVLLQQHKYPSFCPAHPYHKLAACMQGEPCPSGHPLGHACCAAPGVQPGSQCVNAFPMRASL
jgi:membrane protein involved in colicin uptake